MANTKHKPAKGKPISGHPLFPAIVALWFGALFGLGSLAIRPTLIEGVVLKTGIDLIIPAAAPPLGVTARLLIALVMAALGAAIGAALAIRVARRKGILDEDQRTAAHPGAAAEAEAALWQSRTVNTDGPVLPPLAAADDQDAPHDGFGLLAGRRRALAIEPNERPFEPHDLAPLPGGEPQIFDISATQLAPVAGADRIAEALAADALDLGAFAPPAPAEPQLQPVSQAALSVASPAPLVKREVSASAPELGRPVEHRAAPADLGITDLARRLQESMARRRAARVASLAPSATASRAQEPDPVLPLAEPASVLPPPIAMPDALDPVSFDHQDNADLGDQPAPADVVEPEAEPEDAAEDAFASLLSINQSRAEFVRSMETDEPVAMIEPVVIFPGKMASATIAPLRPLDPPAAALTGAPVAATSNAPAVDPAAAEQALRLALAKLQRISGAA